MAENSNRAGGGQQHGRAHHRDHHRAAVDQLLEDLLILRADILAESEETQARADQAHSTYRDSATNLLHYLALRRRDLRPLQQRLSAFGLSSLGRAEGHVLATLDAVLRVVHTLAGRTWQPDPPRCPDDFTQGGDLLTMHTDCLLGPEPAHRAVRIMLTMSTICAEDYPLVRDLVAQGMDCARINCAHDDQATWLRIVEHVRRAAQELGRPCRIAMDLGGPKLRTGPMEPGPAVIKVKPTRDTFGRVTAPARIWLSGQ